MKKYSETGKKLEFSIKYFLYHTHTSSYDNTKPNQLA